MGGTPGRLTSTERRRRPNNADEMVLNRGREERMVRPEGVEPPTYWFVASCSIQLSYGRTLRWMQLSKDTGIRSAEQPSAEPSEANLERSGAPGRIRTSDPLVRSKMLYPANLRPRKAG